MKKFEKVICGLFSITSAILVVAMGWLGTNWIWINYISHRGGLYKYYAILGHFRMVEFVRSNMIIPYIIMWAFIIVAVGLYKLLTTTDSKADEIVKA